MRRVLFTYKGKRYGFIEDKINYREILKKDGFEEIEITNLTIEIMSKYEEMEQLESEMNFKSFAIKSEKEKFDHYRRLNKLMDEI